MKHECPCKICLKLAICIARLHSSFMLEYTEDYPVIINRLALENCNDLLKWIMSHPRYETEYETSYMTDTIEIMRLRKRNEAA